MECGYEEKQAQRTTVCGYNFHRGPEDIDREEKLGLTLRKKNLLFIGNHFQGHFPAQGYAHHFPHVHLVRPKPIRKLPVERLKQTSNGQAHRPVTQSHAQAAPSARTKRDHLKMLPLELYITLQKPLRFK
ncbi:ATP synthase subunit b [Striga asiatica]|uniref:ATP synthase subunit b n=1 Tax=Striga asiatica TaxID=4170 RepID=A0A5A7RAC1_STRAF|nr:ATP synthase subunit b [Striga asiatica]